jgi:hypothetical protein
MTGQLGVVVSRVMALEDRRGPVCLLCLVAVELNRLTHNPRIGTPRFAACLDACRKYRLTWTYVFLVIFGGARRCVRLCIHRGGQFGGGSGPVGDDSSHRWLPQGMSLAIYRSLWFATVPEFLVLKGFGPLRTSPNGGVLQPLVQPRHRRSGGLPTPLLPLLAVAWARVWVGGLAGPNPQSGSSRECAGRVIHSAPLTRTSQALIEHMFYSSRHGEQSSVRPGATPELGYSPLLGPTHRARAGSVARSDLGVASHQCWRLGCARGVRTGSPRRPLGRGLVRAQLSATDRRMAERGYTGGGSSGHQSGLMCAHNPRIVNRRFAACPDVYRHYRLTWLYALLAMLGGHRRCATFCAHTGGQFGGLCGRAGIDSTRSWLPRGVSSWGR